MLPLLTSSFVEVYILKSFFCPFFPFIRPSSLGLTVLVAAVLTTACDNQRINELEEGVASEGDVKMKFGEPEKVWDGENGARIFEYSRRPLAPRIHLITIGPDGKMSSLRQVLAPRVCQDRNPACPWKQCGKCWQAHGKITPFELEECLALRLALYGWSQHRGHQNLCRLCLTAICVCCRLVRWLTRRCRPTDPAQYCEVTIKSMVVRDKTPMARYA
ncbi:MAG: hypothetical protein IPG23_25295 [Burkholderiales bacterium]|nr:hypothetical protein [Burkholderiales bacterium]